MFQYILMGIIVLVILVYIITNRNRFVEEKQDIEKCLSQISVHKENRSTCLKDMMSIANVGYTNEVKAMMGLDDRQKLQQLQFLGSRYPALASIPAYLNAQQKAVDLDTDISACKSLLNNAIQVYNKHVALFPACLIAVAFGFRKETWVDEENMHKNRSVNIEEIDFNSFLH